VNKPGLLYVVRCRFVGTEAEEIEWNRWYSGPKTADMLRMPHFRSGHRFRSLGEDPATYLALWLVDGRDAFESDRYRQRWGFSDWSGHVTDWSRDLVEPVRGSIQLLDLERPITVTATDTEPAGEAGDAGPSVWSRNVGLDRTWDWLAIRAHSDAGDPDPSDVLWTTTFEPLQEA
jgi:hypothetical protein